MNLGNANVEIAKLLEQYIPFARNSMKLPLIMKMARFESFARNGIGLGKKSAQQIFSTIAMPKKLFYCMP